MAWSLCVHLAEEDCLRLIPEHYGNSIDLAQLPEDTEVYRTLQRADTVVVFPLLVEIGGMGRTFIPLPI
jgi:DNA polymerase III alpha subunit